MMSDNEYIEFIAFQIVDSAIKIHKYLGPGLLEKVYETCLEHELKKRGLNVQRQLIIPIEYDSLCLEEGFRLDLLVENKVIVELKAIENHNKLWEAQLISYMKLLHMPLGFLINFNTPLVKNGIKRFKN
jgi:GxxExxY protein